MSLLLLLVPSASVTAVSPQDRESVWGKLNRTQTNLGHPRHADVILGRVLRRP